MARVKTKLASLDHLRRETDIKHNTCLSSSNWLLFSFLHIPVFIQMIENYLFEFIFFSCSRASDFGLMKINNRGKVVSFSEKPKGEDLKAMVMNSFSLLVV